MSALLEHQKAAHDLRGLEELIAVLGPVGLPVATRDQVYGSWLRFRKDLVPDAELDMAALARAHRFGYRCEWLRSLIAARMLPDAPGRRVVGRPVLNH